MKHILQKSSTDCGIAVLAMLAGIDYEAACQSILDSPVPPGLFYVGVPPEYLRATLITNTNLYWEISHFSRRPLFECVLPCEGSAVVIRRPGTASDHWVAVENDQVYDPEMTSEVDRSNYERRDWAASWVLRINRSPMAEFCLQKLRESRWL